MRSRWIVTGLAAALVAGGSTVYAANSHGQAVRTLARSTTLQGGAHGEAVSDLASQNGVTRSTEAQQDRVQQSANMTACDTAKAALTKLRQGDSAEDERERAGDKTEDKRERAADKTEDQAEKGANKTDDKAENAANRAEDQAEQAADRTEDQAEQAAVHVAQAAIKAVCPERETEVEGTAGEAAENAADSDPDHKAAEQANAHSED